MRLPLMSIPRLRMTRTALGCSDLGWLPALAALTVPADKCSMRASAIWERALFPVHRNNTRGVDTRAAIVLGGRRGQPKPRMQRGAGRGQQIAEARDVDCVIRVATIRRAAVRRDQAGVTQFPEMVRDEVLGLTRPVRQLVHHQIAAGQFAEQLPPQRMPRKLQELRWGESPGLRRNHASKLHQSRFDLSSKLRDLGPVATQRGPRCNSRVRKTV